MKNRGGKGVTCYNLTEKSGKLTGIAAVTEDDNIMMITDSGMIIRTPVSDIPERSRSAGGVIVMRLAEDQKLVNFTVVAQVEAQSVEGNDANESNDGEELTEE